VGDDFDVATDQAIFVVAVSIVVISDGLERFVGAFERRALL
jgi:hypothetical protein